MTNINVSSISGEVNVAVVTFVLPLNSALNPFLYTLNTVLEKRRELRYKKLMISLEAKFKGLQKS